MYNVLKPIYKPAGKEEVDGKYQMTYFVRWQKLGMAKNMREAKEKYGHLYAHPILEEIGNT